MISLDKETVQSENAIKSNLYVAPISVMLFIVCIHALSMIDNTSHFLSRSSNSALWE